MLVESIVLSARSCKGLVKQSGYRLSSNAFECLNNFIISFLQCIGRQVSGGAMLGRTAPLSTPTPIPWTAMMGMAGSLVPALEGWFGTWHTLLTQHTNTHPITSIPCCKEIADRCALMVAEECERVIRMAMHPLLMMDQVATCSMICTMNDVVQWVMRVAIRVVESKGLGTVRRGEVAAVIQKAPIFEHLQNYLHPNIVAMEMFPSKTLNRSDSLLQPSILEAPVMSIGEVACDLATGDSGMALIQSPNSSNLTEENLTPDLPTPADSPPNQSPILKPSSLEMGIRRPSMIIACTDVECSWIKLSPDYTGVLVMSRGVETDPIMEKSDRPIMDETDRPIMNETDRPIMNESDIHSTITEFTLPVDPMLRMQKEIDILKELVMRLLRT